MSNSIFFGSFDNCVYGIDLDKGEKTFKYKTGDYIWSNVAAYKNNLIFSGYDGLFI